MFRKKTFYSALFNASMFCFVFGNAFAAAPNISGELKQWHKVVLDFEGPEVSENDEDNPFFNYRLNVTFTHIESGKSYLIPGFFAADGNAAATSASSGNIWRVNFAPDATGEWEYSVDFKKAAWLAVSESKRFGEMADHPEAVDESIEGIDGVTGTLKVEKSDKTGRDFRSKGRLEYVGERYLKFAGSGDYFLKCGVDAPENLLSYVDFDGTFHNDGQKDDLVKTWEAHLKDWKEGDPDWQDGKGKALIGAINYLSSEGLNSMSFLTNNIMGDDQNVFPYTDYNTHDRFDVSKLDQWEIIFTHAQKNGIFLHFKLFESENQGLLDGGAIGAFHKLYYRELIARFGHHLALNWNMCEENGEWIKWLPSPPQFTAERLAMAKYFHKYDPYNNHVVIHNGIDYDDILGPASDYTGASLQTDQEDFSRVHGQVLRWLNESKKAGKQWAVACDEPGDHRYSLVPDEVDPIKRNARCNALWGTFMAGGWGVEWYFGYEHPHSDLSCQDFRSRDLFWDQCNAALTFFNDNKVPLWEMENRNDLVGNPKNGLDKFCITKQGELYLIFLAKVSETELNLSDATGKFEIYWFNPYQGSALVQTKQKTVKAGAKVNIGPPPNSEQKDWVVWMKKAK